MATSPIVELDLNKDILSSPESSKSKEIDAVKHIRTAAFLSQFDNTTRSNYSLEGTARRLVPVSENEYSANLALDETARAWMYAEGVAFLIADYYRDMGGDSDVKGDRTNQLEKNLLLVPSSRDRLEII